MIEAIKPIKPVLPVKRVQNTGSIVEGNDILAPMKRFKEELPVPPIGQKPELSLKKVRIRQKDFYSHRGQVYEKLQNTKAAIASYQKATYYEPSDTNITNQIRRLKIQSLTNLKV